MLTLNVKQQGVVAPRANLAVFVRERRELRGGGCRLVRCDSDYKHIFGKVIPNEFKETFH